MPEIVRNKLYLTELLVSEKLRALLCNVRTSFFNESASADIFEKTGENENGAFEMDPDAGKGKLDAVKTQTFHRTWKWLGFLLRPKKISPPIFIAAILIKFAKADYFFVAEPGASLASLQ